MNSSTIKNYLQQLGLTGNESSIYILLLGIGQSPASTISHRTGIKRVTTYACLDTLKEKGLITSIEKNNVQLFSSLDPEKLSDIFKKRIESERAKLEMSEKIVTLLNDLSGKDISRPKVSFFEGPEGVIDVFKQTLNAKGDIKAFISTKNISPNLKDFLIHEYAKARKKMGIYAKVIAPKSKITENYKGLDKQEYRETKLVDQNILSLDTEIDIFDDKVAFLGIKKEDEIGILIKNKSIADSMRQVFDALWHKL